MNLTMIRRRETCPTCQQAIVPPTPSKVIFVRLCMATFAVGSGLIEYRRAVKRETEAAQLEQLHATSPDEPLDEHLQELYEQGAPAEGGRNVGIPQADGSTLLVGIPDPPWPPSHPSLADDETRAADAAD